MSKPKIELRIISGEYRHRKISWHYDPSIRPTKDRIREAVFSALGNINDLIFVDLYSGSGAIGLEALSRGAGFVYFNDVNKLALKYIKENLINLDVLKDRYSINEGKDIDLLESFKEKNIKADIIYLDPPYKEGEYENIVDYIIINNILSEDGVLITECDRELNINLDCSKHKKYKYGEIFVNIYWR